MGLFANAGAPAPISGYGVLGGSLFLADCIRSYGVGRAETGRARRVNRPDKSDSTVSSRPGFLSSNYRATPAIERTRRTSLAKPVLSPLSSLLKTHARSRK